MRSVVLLLLRLLNLCDTQASPLDSEMESTGELWSKTNLISDSSNRSDSSDSSDKNQLWKNKIYIKNIFKTISLSNLKSKLADIVREGSPPSTCFML